jgi:Holliday junction DNA helicase RuvA
MLSSMNSQEIQQAIGSEDVEKIRSVKGIGIKTAQRVIVDLKDKILKTYEFSEELSVSNNTIKNEALSALEVLGFSRKKIDNIIQVILQDSPNISLEELIKKALKNL